MTGMRIHRPSWRLGIAVLATAIALAGVFLEASAQADPSDYGFASVGASLSSSQAGDHPDFTTVINLKTDPSGKPDPAGNRPPYARTKDLTVDLPPGLIGNPNSVARCTSLQFSTAYQGGGCPQDSQVGVTLVRLYSFNRTLTEPVFNMEPPSDEPDTVARLAFWGYVYPIQINVKLRSEGDYGVTAELKAIPSGAGLISATTTLWAVPAASSHDRQRLTVPEAVNVSESPPRSSGLAPAPFMINPTRCAGPLAIDFASDSYSLPGQFVTASAPLTAITGCGLIGFAPEFSVTPTSREAAAPSGLDADLAMPQNEAVNGLATSELRYATVTLPQGMTIAAGAADGLESCSAEQVGLGSRTDAACPAGAKIGTAEIDSPALSRVLQGAIYQRSPRKGDLFGIWLVADELGVHVKIPGEVHPDPVTGQLTAIFNGTPEAEGNPQVPVREFKLHFKGGPRGVLATPSRCGVYQTHYEFTPWSRSSAVVGDTPMTIDRGCGAGGFAPKLAGGTVDPSAGAFSSLVTKLTRESGEENVSGLDVTLPPGLLAKIAGVPLCEGATAESGQCPPASQVGTTTVASGPGPSPLWIPQPGKDPTAVYLGGPYKGAPYSLIVKTPAQAGPFDLGTVVVRAAIYVDPESARVTVKSDPLPQILEGVPISYRTIHVNVSRPQFALNPTNCKPQAFSARVTSPAGSVATPGDRFQAAACASLPFKPKLGLRLFGKTGRGGHPRLRAVLRARAGEANIARASVALPHSEFLDQAHIGTVCTRVQFAAEECPAGSIYGVARAVSPLLDRPLEGPVYLRSSNHQLPDLVVALHGQVDIDLVGRIDSVNGGIRTTFEAVPDAPVTKFTLEMQGGKKGLLVNSRNLCESPSSAIVKLRAQNEKAVNQHARMKDSCPGR